MVTKSPRKTPFFRGLLFFFLLNSTSTWAAESQPRFLAFASENWLTLAIGQYDPAKGWLQATDSFKAPPPDEVFTLFGNTGKLGDVLGKEDRRADPHWTPIEWRMRVDRGSTMRQPFALAVEGSWANDAVLARELPLDDPATVRAVAGFLKKKGLKVDAPFLTQAYQIDLNGDGRMETVVCAHSDRQTVLDHEPANIYAVALVLSGSAGQEKITVLAKQCSFKPARRSLDEHEHLYGTRDFYRLIAFHDIDGDGHPEIVLYRAKSDATEVNIFSFHKGRKKKVLSAFKFNYN